jgi:hypothetical protein
MGQDVDHRAARLAEHEAPDSPLLVAERVCDLEALLDGCGVDGIASATSTEMPGAAMSSLPTLVTCADGLVGEATVATQPARPAGRHTPGSIRR